MKPLLEVNAVSRRYPVRRGLRRSQLHAVDSVDLTIGEGECLGLVGESGCGKSTLARLVSRLIDVSQGSIRLAGQEIGAIPAADFASQPARTAIQVVFQDPTESLNPGFTVFAAIADPLRQLGGNGSRKVGAQETEERVMSALDDVGLPREFADRYPHQLSGGQKARVGIARAIVVNPRLLVLDEPTSALDVSVQAVILRLLDDLRRRRGMSYLFVSHDLNVVRLLCDRIAVMYLGRIVESGPAQAVFDDPQHPYTRALIAAIPDPARRGQQIARLEGSASSPIDPDPDACRFAGRCAIEMPGCRKAMPELLPRSGGRLVACHRSPAAVPDIPDPVSPPASADLTTKVPI